MEGVISTSEKWFYTLTDSSFNAIVTTSNIGKILYCNRSAYDLFGYQQEELINRNIDQLIPDWTTCAAYFLADFSPHFNKTGIACSIVNKCGQRLSVEIAVSFIETVPSNYDKILIYNIARYIPLDQIINKENRPNNKGFYAFADTAIDAIFLSDQNGYIVSWSKEAEKIFGYKESEIVGEHVRIIIPRGHYALNDMSRQCCMQKEKNENQFSKVLSLRKNGTEFLADLSTAKGELCGNQYHVNMVRDIDSCLKKNIYIQESEQGLKVLAESAVDGIIIVDKDGVIVFWNRGASNIFGFKDCEVIGKSIDVILPERLILKNREKFSKITLKGNDFIGLTTEKKAIRKNGNEFSAEVSYSSLKGTTGTFYFAVIRDISERKRFATMLQKVNQCILGFGTSADKNIDKALKCACDLLNGQTSLYIKKKGHCFILQGSWKASRQLKTNCQKLNVLWKSIIKCENDKYSIFSTDKMNNKMKIDTLINPIGIKTCIGTVIRRHNKIAGILAVFFDKKIVLGNDQTKMFSILAQAACIEEERKMTVDMLHDKQHRLRISEGRLKKFSQKILTVREEEKKALSRELHDELGSMIVSVSLCLSIAEEESRKADKIKLAEMIHEAQMVIKKSTAKVRMIADDLRPPELDIIGLSDAIKKYCIYIAGQAGVKIDCRFRINKNLLNDIQAIALYRIAQEAMNNIIKHAEAKSVSILLSDRGGFIYLKIRDDGKGFNTDIEERKVEAQRRCLGIQGIRERTEHLKGMFFIKSRLGYGSEILIKIPVSKRQRGDNEHKINYCR